MFISHEGTQVHSYKLGWDEFMAPKGVRPSGLIYPSWLLLILVEVRFILKVLAFIC